ncbi:acyl-CoA dehydrogenase family protein [Kitasatospora sp. NPDC006697]|uniref:acyl-CoA dehydrogenase family protein n=1 Tax=Kitasatospora sp. NPDC006697 TaxID=3364020 RepID=UPI00367EE243
MSAEKLDELLGDPWAPGNPAGHAAALAADEQRRPPAAAGELLAEYGLGAEFVPAALGGRLTRADELAELLKAVWRRDPALGLDHGFGSFLAAAPVWTSGGPEQQRAVADLLLSGGRIAAPAGPLDGAPDRPEFTARPAEGGWLLSGRQEFTAGLDRADALVLRTDLGPVLVHRAELPADGRVRELPPVGAAGLRGLRFGGLELTDCPVPAGALLDGRTAPDPADREGASRSYRLTRAFTAGLAAGPLDTALRTALANALDRRLYGAPVADLPYVRSVLARAREDLLIVDLLGSVLVRALHLVPDAPAGQAPAADALAARTVQAAVEELRAALGARGFIREGAHAIFQKTARDLTVHGVLRASRADTLRLVLPHLPRLAPGAPADPDLFDLGGPLPPLDPRRPTADPAAPDPVLATLAVFAAAPGAAGDDPLARFATRLGAELDALGADCAALSRSALPRSGPTADPDPAALALAERYAVLFAAGCAAGVHRQAPDRLPRAALLGVLDRLTRRLGGAAVLTAAEREQVERQLFETAVELFHDRTMFDLTARRIPG